MTQENILTSIKSLMTIDGNSVADATILTHKELLRQHKDSTIELELQDSGFIAHVTFTFPNGKVYSISGPVTISEVKE